MDKVHGSAHARACVCVCNPVRIRVSEDKWSTPLL